MPRGKRKQRNMIDPPGHAVSLGYIVVVSGNAWGTFITENEAREWKRDNFNGMYGKVFNLLKPITKPLP